MNNHEDKTKLIYCVSDAHFGIDIAGYAHREQLFYDFCEAICPTAESLFIVGDLFDFWVEYKRVIRSDYLGVLCALQKLVNAGVKIHYIAGNHDFALGNFLPKTMGITVHCNSYSGILHGKKVLFHHGDGLAQFDSGYRILKKLLRNKINQSLYKLIHPDLGIGIATFFSGSSRKYLGHRLNEKVLLEYTTVAEKLIGEGNEIVMFGHTHRPALVKFDKGYYCNTGNWIKDYSYVVIENGTPRLERFVAP